MVVVIFAYLATAPEPQLPRIKRGMGGASGGRSPRLTGSLHTIRQGAASKGCKYNEQPTVVTTHNLTAKGSRLSI